MFASVQEVKGSNSICIRATAFKELKLRMATVFSKVVTSHHIYYRKFLFLLLSEFYQLIDGSLRNQSAKKVPLRGFTGETYKHSVLLSRGTNWLSYYLSANLHYVVPE